MVRKPKGERKKGNGNVTGDTNTGTDTDIRTATTKIGTVKPGLTCIAGICFHDDGSFTVKIPRDADPKCAIQTTAAIMQGKKINYEIERSEVESKTEEEERKYKEALLNETIQKVQELEEELKAERKAK